MQCPECNSPMIKEANLVTSSYVLEDIADKYEPETDTLPIKSLSYKELSKDYDRRNSRQKLISDALGKKMLSGWTMLGSMQSDIFVRKHNVHTYDVFT